jgi:cation diffusion facilitator family transporter
MAQPRLQRLMGLSIAAAVATIALKSAAYLLTRSVGFLSDALESVVNLIAAITALASLWYAARPVDREHTYGHQKIEYVSSGFEGVLILVAAVGIIWYAIDRLLHPLELQKIDVGSGFIVVATIINFIVGRLLLSAGRRANSIVLEADGKHLMTDVWTSGGVLIGVVLAWLTKLFWLDAVIALVMAALITRTGFGLVWRSFNGLMDRALPEEEQARVRLAIERELLPGMDYHALRTRQAGSKRFVDFHLLVPGIFTVRRAHEIGDRIEQAIRNVFPGIEVTIHIEPIEEQTAYEDSALLPLEREVRNQSPETTPSERGPEQQSPIPR